MMSVNSCNLGQSESYFDHDYYSKSVEGDNQTQWQGRLAPKMGLSGPVSEEDFKSLMRAIDDSGKTCVEHDITFSAPKSVSIAAEMGDETLRAEILEAHRQAVKETLKEIENNVISTRLKDHGVIQHVKTGNMCAATFEHSTARPTPQAPPDMQLHTHCAVANLTEYNGQAYSIDGKALYDVQKRYGAEYRSRLAAKLQARGYGIKVTDPEKGLFEMTGVKPEVIRHFSKRREQIEAEMAKSGQSGAKAAQRANLSTRCKKDPDIDMEAVRSTWRAEMKALGQEAVVKSEDPIKATVQDRQEAFSRAVARLEQADYAWTQKDLETAVINEGVGVAMTRERAQKLIVKAQKSGELINLGKVKGADPVTSPSYFTTEANIRQQEQIFYNVAEGRGQAQALDSATAKASLDQVCQANGWQLAPEQAQLVMHIATSKDQFVAVRGLAGTGKTFSLNAAREVLEANGYEVRGMSASGKAADELQQDAHLKLCGTIQHEMNQAEKDAGNNKIDEDYATKTSWNFEGLKKGDKPLVILMDEASLTANNTMFYAQELAKAQGAKLVLVGDDRQLLPVGAGNSFSELVQQGLIATTDLTAIQRQKDAALRQAVVEAVKGDPAKTLDILSKNGSIAEVKKESKLLQAAAAEYCSRPEAMQADTVVLTATNATRTKINTLIRDGLKAQGKLQGGREFEIQTGKGQPTSREFAVGDRIVFFKNDNDLGVNNGTQGVVSDVKEKGLWIQVGDKQRVFINMSKYNHVDHAYCLTPHKAQGLTKGHAIPVLLSRDGKMNSRNSMYVDISRAKFSSKIFTDNKEKVGQQVSKWAEKITGNSFAKSPKSKSGRKNKATNGPRKLTGAVSPKIAAIGKGLALAPQNIAFGVVGKIKSLLNMLPIDFIGFDQPKAPLRAGTISKAKSGQDVVGATRVKFGCERTNTKPGAPLIDKNPGMRPRMHR